MAITLRLSDEELIALRAYAQEHGISTHEAVHEAVRQLLHNDRRDNFSRRMRERDRELLDRLGRRRAYGSHRWAGRVRDLARRGRL
jgi:hypothetical protein